MKKLLLCLLLLMFLVGNVFADELAHRSQGQRIYIPFVHTRVSTPGGIQDLASRISVRNYDGDARIEYIEYYDVDKITGEVLPPVKLNLSLPPNPPGESFDLPPWSNWFWFTRDFFDPAEAYVTRAAPFVIIKWVSTNGRRIIAPLFGGNQMIYIGGDLKAVYKYEATILEELWYW